MPLSQEQIVYLSRLAGLQLSSEEIESLTVELTSVLAFFEQITDVDTAGVVPTPIAKSAKNRIRDDKFRPSLAQGQALANAPRTDGEFFLVPKVIG